MKILTDSINPHYSTIQRMSVVPKGGIILLDNGRDKFCYGKITSGEHKDKLVIYLAYDVHKVESSNSSIEIVPNNNIIAGFELDDNEALQPFYKYVEKPAEWLNKPE